MARSMLSLGILFSRAVMTAVRNRGFALTSPPPMRAATVISLISLVNSLPRLASLAAFLCLMVLHLEWPDMGDSCGGGDSISLLAQRPRGRKPDGRADAADAEHAAVRRGVCGRLQAPRSAARAPH